MGGRSATSDEFKSYYRDNSHISRATSASQVFRESCMAPEFDPSQIKLPREACDSVDCPHSRGIIFAEDVTGSMGRYLLELIRDLFPKLINMTYSSVSYNPHIMFMGVGDVTAGDRAPLQVTQFEADLRMLDQVQKIYLERRGGGNAFESYLLPWYFAGKHVKMDCWDKRREKGFLFTFGDEQPTPRLTQYEEKQVFGKNATMTEKVISGADCLRMAEEKFNCYHILLHGGGYGYEERRMWKELMGGHACDLSDYECLPELVIAILSMHEGLSKTEAINKIQSDHARRVVADALEDHEEHVAKTEGPVDGGHIDLF